MSSIAELLDEETRTRLGAAASEPEYVVIKAATDPNPPKQPRPLTEADALDIDPESEAFIDAECVDCGVPLLIDPKVPDSVDPTAPRVPICDKHAQERARYATEVQVTRRTPVKHEEIPLTDFDNMTDAEIGALVRLQMKAIKARDVSGAAPEVLEARRQAEAEQTEAIKAEQVLRKDRVYRGFMASKDDGVPVLDLTEVTSLDEQPSAALISPYNRARFVLTGEGPLPVPDKDGLLPEGAEATTYRVLIAEHKRLRKLAKGKKAKPKKAKAKAPKQVEVVVAATDPAEEARMVKAKALSKVLSCSIDEALAIMADA